MFEYWRQRRKENDRRDGVAERLDALGLRIDRMEGILNGVHANTSRPDKALPEVEMSKEKEEEKKRLSQPIVRRREGSISTKPAAATTKAT